MVLVSFSKCFDYSDMCLKVRHDAPYKMAIALNIFSNRFGDSDICLRMHHDAPYEIAIALKPSVGA